MFDILAIGEVVIDFSPLEASADGNPVYEAQPGGAPSNLLAGASKLGARTGLLGAIGGDLLGKFLRMVLQRSGIDSTGLQEVDDAPTPFTIVEYDERGDRTFHCLQTLTSLNVLSPEMLDWDVICQSRVVHLAGSLLGLENGLTVYDKAKSYAGCCGKIVSCDLNWRPYTYDRIYAQSVILPRLVRLDILKLSHEEMELLTDTWELSEGCRKLRSMGIKLICITLGPGGCYFDYLRGSGYLPTYDIQVVDTNGSGDAFTAAMLVELLALKKDVDEVTPQQMREVMEFANAAGASCASHRGAICGVPSREQILCCIRETPLLRMRIPENENLQVG